MQNYADHYYDISIVDKEQIAVICQKEKINGIISNALEIAVPTAAYVAELLDLNGIPYEVALNARNKFQMREGIPSKSLPTTYLHTLSIRIPTLILSGNSQTYRRFMQ